MQRDEEPARVLPMVETERQVVDGDSSANSSVREEIREHGELQCAELKS